LLGDVMFRMFRMFRWVLAIGRRRFRVAGTVLALATVPLGLLLAAGQLAALILLLLTLLTSKPATPTP